MFSNVNEKKKHQRMLFSYKTKKTAVRETERGGKYGEETGIRLYNTVTVP